VQDTATQRWTAGALHALCKAALEEAWGNLLFECIIAARGVQVLTFERKLRCPCRLG
jgi:hypothetical protein